jgi:alkylation response protein AidB-like acyl-CoA dehydrogenase
VDLSPTDEQRQLAEALSRFLSKASSPGEVRSAEATGFDPVVWEGLVGMGAVAMGVPAVHGGSGAALADLAVVARECGAALASAPVVEAAVAARLLARAIDTGAADAAAEPWLAGAVDGAGLVTFAPRRAAGGVAALVPGAGVATAAVVSNGPDLLLVPVPDGTARTVTTLGNDSFADLPIDPEAALPLASGAEATSLFGVALDEWRVLRAAWLSGLGHRALELAVGYASERVQFDAPIGSFQAVQHRLADAATALDGAALLAAKAVWALDEDEATASLLAPMAFWFAGEAAQQAASWALHFHGGYGFMEEYDIQLHFRRAKAARLALGDPQRELQVVADRLFPHDRAPATTRIPPASTPTSAAPAERRGPDFRLDRTTEAFRTEIRSFLAEHVTAEVIETAHRTGTIHDWGLHRAMAAQGWLSASWPEEVGGQGRSPLEMNVLSEEMYLSGAPVDGLGVASLVAHTLLLEGSDWQRATIVPEILSGEVICCLGYSEPDAGSDVASCTTRAERRGEHWVVNGQKMFTTLAHEAGYVFLLTRTNPDVAKHRGLTMFVVPMDTPGIELTPVHTVGGERTNITFYNEVEVDDRYRVGEVDGGWKVMMTALVFERNSSWVGESVRLLDHASSWAAGSEGPDGRPVLTDPLVRTRLAAAAVGNEVASLLGWRAAWMASTGTLPGVEGTMAKLFTTEHYQRCANDLLDVLGAEGLRRHGEPGAAADGWIEATYRHCQVTTIYGGTSEVLRGIIAQRGLGLPKAR